MPLSKKYYNDFVTIICKSWNDAPQTKESKGAMEILVADLEVYFKKDNKNFDLKKFAAAVSKKCDL
jgi:hypothetical protein